MTQQEPQPDQDRQTEDQSSQKLAALEAVLFMAAEPLPAAELAEILDVTPGEADQLARRLEELYAGRGIQVTRVAGGYQVCTRPEYGPSVAKLHKPERFRLSRAALETLAIVAYKQPVTRPEVDAIRGVNSDSVLDTLTQYELVREAGRKEAPGRPLLYRTTDNFLGHFGLDSVDDLPRLDAIPVDQAQVQADVPPSAPESAEVESDPTAASTELQPDPSPESAEVAPAPAPDPAEVQPDSAPESTETREQPPE
jgi:segregation and condensation protein B